MKHISFVTLYPPTHSLIHIPHITEPAEQTQHTPKPRTARGCVHCTVSTCVNHLVSVTHCQPCLLCESVPEKYGTLGAISARGTSPVFYSVQGAAADLFIYLHANRQRNQPTRQLSTVGQIHDLGYIGPRQRPVERRGCGSGCVCVCVSVSVSVCVCVCVCVCE